nr:hypothetical protein [uncultured bacterium]
MIRATAHHSFARRKGKPSLNPDLMKDFLLEAFPNPERKGCPDDKTIKALAEDKLPPGHPARLHVGSCSECYAEYRHFRQDWEEANVTTAFFDRSKVKPSRQFKAVPWAVAAALLLMFGGGYVAFRHYQSAPVARPQLASVEPVNVSVDLSESGTVRGPAVETTPLPETSLPSSVVNLALVLPRFSDTGHYIVNVSRDKSGAQIVASGSGNAVKEDGGKVSLKVTLDLRAAQPGAYFLATVRGTDNGTYYYPLKIN